MTDYPPPPPSNDPPPPPGGYPPPGRPQQPGGYPPVPGGYPPSGGYPGQPGGYPPQPGGYPPQPGGYPPQPGGYPPQFGAFGPPPDNYLVWAILSTIFCCLPLGIVSIVKSTQVSSLWNQGRPAEAQAAAESAKKFAIWAAVASAAIFVVYVLLAAVGGLASSGFS